MGRRRSYPGNARRVSTIEYGPGATSVELAAAMGIANNPFSPMAVGVHSPGATARGYPGVPGYGVNRMGQDVGPIQSYYGAVVPLAQPRDSRLGFGQGVSGQPGLPQTGFDNAGFGLLGANQLAAFGMGA